MTIEPIADFEFGPLAWNDEHLQWRGRARLPDFAEFDLFVSTPAWERYPNIDKQNPDTLITAAARDAFQSLLRLETVARAGVLAEYVPLYPEWNEREKITADDFSARLTLEWVRLSSLGEAEFGYDDDDMFGGHALVGHVSPTGMYDHGEMSG